MCMRNTVFVKQVRGTVLAEQSDPLFASANLLIMTPKPPIEILCTRKFIAEVQGTSGTASTTCKHYTTNTAKSYAKWLR